MVLLCVFFFNYSYFDDQNLALPQKFWLDLLPICYSCHTENLSGQSFNFNTHGTLIGSLGLCSDTLADPTNWPVLMPE